MFKTSGKSEQHSTIWDVRKQGKWIENQRRHGAIHWEKYVMKKENFSFSFVVLTI